MTNQYLNNQEDKALLYEENQKKDENINQLQTQISGIKYMAIDIGNLIHDQDECLDSVEKKTINANNQIEKNTENLKNIERKISTRDTRNWIIIFIQFIILIAVIVCAFVL